jgi:hypothetical protein
MHSFFFLGILFFSHLSSFLKLNLKSQTIMDEHRHKILITRVFHGHISSKKIKPPPSFTNKHRSSTEEKENEERQAQKLN